MLYYNRFIDKKCPELLSYFKSAIFDTDKTLGHCLLFWGPDILSQCELALEIARMLNCKESANINCDCLNCRWIREQTHPAVKIYTRLDFKESDEKSSAEESSAGKKNINIAQAKSIISELIISSDYHRVYIFCDRDEEGNLKPLNQLNFPEVTSNALLKTFEEPPSNTTFIFLTTDKSDVISTVVSRAQSFFVPANVADVQNFDIVESFITNYWEFEKGQVLEIEKNLLDLISNNDAQTVFTQIQNYMTSVMKSNFENKPLFYKLMNDLRFVEDAKCQISLTPAMNIQTVCENLCFKLFL